MQLLTTSAVVRFESYFKGVTPTWRFHLRGEESRTPVKPGDRDLSLRLKSGYAQDDAAP